MSLYWGIRKETFNWRRRSKQIFVFLLFGGGLAAPGLLLAHGGTDEEVIEHFDEHLDDFEAEINSMVKAVDAIVMAHREGESVAASIRELIDLWEHVQIHEVIEVHAVHLYPPVWQGIYAMMQTTEKSGSEATMEAAGERMKGALWQGLGALKALARAPMRGLEAGDHRAGQGGPGAADFLAVSNQIELTGDDNMLFNETHFVVRAGEPVTLKLVNIGELPKEVMGHNVVVLRADAEVEPFALAADDAEDNEYIPADAQHREQMIAHTALLGPDETDTISFTLEEPGTYPFLCSFPGHFRIMQGTIRATVDPDKAPVAAILEQLEAAVTTYEEGHPDEASSMVLDAYLHIFEGLEGELIEHDPELVLQLELDFNAGLPGLFAEGAPPEEAVSQLDAMRERLLHARELLDRGDTERTPIF